MRRRERLEGRGEDMEHVNTGWEGYDSGGVGDGAGWREGHIVC